MGHVWFSFWDLFVHFLPQRFVFVNKRLLALEPDKLKWWHHGGHPVYTYNYFAAWLLGLLPPHPTYFFPSLRGAPRRRRVLGAVTPPCSRSMPLPPPTRRKVKAPQHPWAGCRPSTSAPHMPPPTTLNIPSCGSTRAPRWRAPRPWPLAAR